MNKFFLILFIVSFAHNGFAQVSDSTIHTPVNVTYKVELVVPDLEIPWGMAFLPDGRILVTELKGKLISYNKGLKKEIKNVPDVYARGQGGFLDIALHPDFETNGWIYFTYVSKEGIGNGGNTALMRAKLKNDSLVNTEILYKGSPNSTKPYHFGSRIVFDKDGYVYFGIGDRGDHFENPQDITKDGGKIYRLHDNGTIPSDNPFIGNANARTAIFSYGHRNPQGLIKHPVTGEIWEHEHGPQGGDEINIIKKGNNYGWPVISYGINYDNTILTDKTSMPGMEQPLYYYVPSIAPSGMAFIDSDKYGDWKGNLLIGSLKFQYLERLVIQSNKVVYREKLMPDSGRVRNVKMGPDGLIYVAVENKGIFKILPGK